MSIHTDTAPITAREIHAIYMGLVIMISLSALDQSIVATALPRIVTDLGGIAHLSWVVTAYVLASTAMMPLYGKLSDQYGRKPLLYTAIITFLAGSALCGLAQNMTELIAFRAIQGLGAGGFLPLAQIVIGDLVPPAERGKRQGSIAAVYAAASVLGPVLGGLLTDWLSWHWIFYVNLPVGAAALYVISKSLHHTSPHHAHEIDYLGSVLLTGAVTAALLVLALGGTQWPWNSDEVKYLGLLAAALTAALLWHVRRVPEPVLPPDLFHNRVFNVASAVLALTFVGMMGSSVFFPLLFQMVMGVSPAHSGLLTMPMMIGLVIASTQNGRVLAKFHGRYKPAQTIGLGLATLSFAVLAWGIANAAGYLVLEPAIFTLGAGLGLVMPNMTMAVQNALPANRRGVGTAMMTFFRSLGGLIGVTGSGAILAQRLHGQTATADLYRHAIGDIFTTGTVLVGLGLLMLLFLPELPMVQHAPVRK
ncbi:DHA2 family efflux MFS transporter permease subunit [Rugamonas sp. FT82W]|uniref:DHA2 family efflux MFS transporter permease subunit n=1 Tax=Duganella vulcania TaxID=2692166 RepID=A0A845FXQ4_9BURK|nr:MDR family MFS transporter [Duganella vulcania]MYM86020.1 DHA2 family efflux MFS transporter permease subunit [Duganella vulcania]